MRLKCVTVGILGVILVGICTAAALRHTTWLESAAMSGGISRMLEISEQETELQETVEMPFELIRSVSVIISNDGKDNNSRWELVLEDKEGQRLARKRFDFTKAADGRAYRIDLDRTVRVRKGESYTIRLKALTINDANKLGLYVSDAIEETQESTKLYINGEEVQGVLCMTVYGSDVDFFWGSIVIVAGILILFGILRAVYLGSAGEDWRQDTVLRSIFVGLVVFLLYLPYADTNVCVTLGDEWDNICGGTLVADGKVIYRDYVTQHMPLAYYLCAFFSLLGASSVEQMRILFYIVLGLVWAGMYIRYRKSCGERIMIWLPFIVTLASKAMVGITASMVMSDVIQEMCMILLLLEFMAYRQDRKLGWSRCVVVSIGMWGAIGTAFVSVYSVFILGTGFLICEIRGFKAQKCSVKKIVKRYVPLMICVISIPLLGVLLMIGQDALYQFYKQAYLFNREVYPNYQDMGGNILAPFVSGVSAFLTEFLSGMLAVANTGLSAETVTFMLFIGGYFFAVVSSLCQAGKTGTIGKTAGYWLFITFYIANGATRGLGTHGLAFLGMLISVTVIEFMNGWGDHPDRWKTGFCVVMAVFLMQPYFTAVVSGITAEQKTVSEENQYIVEHTEAGEEIFMDMFSFDPVYLIAKERYPVNRATYVLPWYMDWYEAWELEDLREKQPEIVVWNPEHEIWGWTYYCNELSDYIYENYTRRSDTSLIWEIK